MGFQGKKIGKERKAIRKVTAPSNLHKSPPGYLKWVSKHPVCGLARNSRRVGASLDSSSRGVKPGWQSWRRCPGGDDDGEIQAKEEMNLSQKGLTTVHMNHVATLASSYY